MFYYAVLPYVVSYYYILSYSVFTNTKEHRRHKQAISMRICFTYMHIYIYIYIYMDIYIYASRNIRIKKHLVNTYHVKMCYIYIYSI